ncbi:MAG TPA: DNA methyltransferase [Acidimicrobiales bacterium]|nr:DNA methyltransferase [Acidimicrobiales bacterium]
MASELDVLLDKVEDPALRADLKRQVEILRARRRFGLVFEEHLPERIQLPEHAIRRGTRVVRRDHDDDEPREVLKVAKKKATVRDAGGDIETLAVDDLVVVADFGEPIYPGLRRLGSLEAGGDKPAHVVIKGENHHVLEALQFTHAGKVDCIYIDPPYNTGARDWKYGNDYVDKDDAYRHSKWLAFMERRLRLAKQLLNPDDSVLIVTIDEKEYLRLGLLLEQVFRGAYIEMVTTIISAKGAYRRGHFSRVEEHIFFVSLGSATVQPWISNMLPAYEQTDEAPIEDEADHDGDAGRSNNVQARQDAADEAAQTPIEWLGLRRREPSSVRGARPNQFYAIFVNEGDGSLHSVGEAIADDVDRHSVEVPAGTVALWPLKPDGTEMLWGLTPDVLRRNWAAGWARVNNWSTSKQKGTVQYLPSGTIDRIRSGEITVTDRAGDGSVIGYMTPSVAQGVTPKRVWHLPSHNAETGGTSIVSALVPGRRFPYPKSLYAVEDTLRFVLRDKPDAVVVDYFGGSGTTAHAVARLNRQDGGRRQSILVTNNEVSEAEAKALTTSGARRGDSEWEALGIFEHVTRPRITAAITGVTPDGEAVKGDYRFVDEFPMSEGLDENVEFLELTYLDPEDVEISAAFEGVAPMLWLRAGGRGEMIEHDAPYYAVMDAYGVLFNPDRWRKFVSDLHDDVKTVFIVTDSPSIFAAVAAELPAGVEAVRLYENYLSTFTLNTRRTMPAEVDAQ